MRHAHGNPHVSQHRAHSARYPECANVLWFDLAQRPDWLAVKDIHQEDLTLAHLDQGERDAITLAQELQADLLLIDERLGRQAAIDRKFNVTGTVGILGRAATRGLIDIAEAVS